MTGVSGPCGEPKFAELRLDTSNLSPEQSAQEVILYLEKEGFIGSR